MRHRPRRCRRARMEAAPGRTWPRERRRPESDTSAAASLDSSAATIAPAATTATSSRRGLPAESRADVPATASKRPLRSATAAAPVRPTKKSSTFQWPATSETAPLGETSPASAIAPAPSAADEASVRRHGRAMTRPIATRKMAAASGASGVNSDWLANGAMVPLPSRRRYLAPRRRRGPARRSAGQRACSIAFAASAAR